jgi:hypothetical protein
MIVFQGLIFEAFRLLTIDLFYKRQIFLSAENEIFYGSAINYWRGRGGIGMVRDIFPKPAAPALRHGKAVRLASFQSDGRAEASLALAAICIAHPARSVKRSPS